jgi:hypothetical protein
MALYELDFGVVAPVLEKPQGVDNRSFDPFPIWLERTRLVLAYELLLAAGLTSTAAFKTIREYGTFDPLLELSSSKGRAGLEGSVKSWRKRLKRGEVKSPIAQSRHKRNMALLELAKSSATPLQMHEFARKFLEAAAAETAELATSGQ